MRKLERKAQVLLFGCPECSRSFWEQGVGRGWAQCSPNQPLWRCRKQIMCFKKAPSLGGNTRLPSFKSIFKLPNQVSPNHQHKNLIFLSKTLWENHSTSVGFYPSSYTFPHLVCALVLWLEPEPVWETEKSSRSWAPGFPKVYICRAESFFLFRKAGVNGVSRRAVGVQVCRRERIQGCWEVATGHWFHPLETGNSL